MRATYAGIFAQSSAVGEEVTLLFDRTYHQHVNHGYFWDRGVAAPGTFFYEAWVSPTTGAEYIISDGYGGAHNLLWGFAGLSGGYGTVTGNVYIDAGAVSFQNQDGVYEGDWHLHSVGWDGANIRTYVDGVLSKVVPCSGTRQTTGNVSEGVLFVGGSSHSNYNGYIRMIRGFEGWCPVAGNFYYPEINFKASFNSTGNAFFGASFLADYTRSVNIIPDLSSGYNGSVHPGYLGSELDGSNTGNFNGGVPASGYLPPLPVFTNANPFVQPTIFRGTPASIPVGAVGYDDFSRANVTLTWSDSLSLGTSRTGQDWSSSATNTLGWGIIDGHAYCNNGGGVPSVATFDLGKVDQDVTVHRKSTDSYAGPVVHYTDDNNYIWLEIYYSGAEYAILYEKVAGVDTNLGSAATGVAANNFRIAVSGTTVNAYINGSGTPLITGTTSLASGNRVGMRSAQLLTRVKSITAY